MLCGWLLIRMISLLPVGMQEGEALQYLLGIGAHDALPQRPIGLDQALQGSARLVLEENGEGSLVRVIVRAEEADDVLVVELLVQGQLLGSVKGQGGVG